ncbi:DUF1593-domain-containing protein [Whalleya microplaca]|nr:DUF1593-domain-containing protein [Whalleya microplaca]
MKRSEQNGFLSDETQQRIGYWPSPKYLKSVVMVGHHCRGMGCVGDDKASRGSDWIVRAIDMDDPRPVYVSVWGSGNTLAQAIWDVSKTRTEEELKVFLQKLRVYTIGDQDRGQYALYSTSAQYWMRKTFPDLFHIIGSGGASSYTRTIRDEYWSLYKSEIQGKANIGSIYPNYIYGVEGDSPSWLYLWPGLNDPEDPTQSSFGGRFVTGVTQDGSTIAYQDDSSDAANRSSEALSTTIPDQVNDFVARMNWAANGSGNRNPTLVLEAEKGYAPVVLNGTVNSTVRVSAEGSIDPEGDALSYSWTHDDGTGYSGKVLLSGSNSSTVTVTVPSDASGDNIHIVVRAVDDGSPPLASYRQCDHPGELTNGCS